MSDPVKENRVKRIVVNPRMIINLLRMWKVDRGPMVLEFTNEEIPEDCIILSVSTSWCSQSVEIMIAHESFPRVQEGTEAPAINAYNREFDIARLEDLVIKRIKELESQHSSERSEDV